MFYAGRERAEKVSRGKRSSNGNPEFYIRTYKEMHRRAPVLLSRDLSPIGDTVPLELSRRLSANPCVGKGKIRKGGW